MIRYMSGEEITGFATSTEADKVLKNRSFCGTNSIGHKRVCVKYLNSTTSYGLTTDESASDYSPKILHNNSTYYFGRIGVLTNASITGSVIVSTYATGVQTATVSLFSTASSWIMGTQNTYNYTRSFVSNIGASQIYFQTTEIDTKSTRLIASNINAGSITYNNDYGLYTSFQVYENPRFIVKYTTSSIPQNSYLTVSLSDSQVRLYNATVSSTELYNYSLGKSISYSMTFNISETIDENHLFYYDEYNKSNVPNFGYSWANYASYYTYTIGNNGTHTWERFTRNDFCDYVPGDETSKSGTYTTYFYKPNKNRSFDYKSERYSDLPKLTTQLQDRYTVSKEYIFTYDSCYTVTSSSLNYISFQNASKIYTVSFNTCKETAGLYSQYSNSKHLLFVENFIVPGYFHTGSAVHYTFQNTTNTDDRLAKGYNFELQTTSQNKNYNALYLFNDSKKFFTTTTPICLIRRKSTDVNNSVYTTYSTGSFYSCHNNYSSSIFANIHKSLVTVDESIDYYLDEKIKTSYTRLSHYSNSTFYKSAATINQDIISTSFDINRGCDLWFEVLPVSRSNYIDNTVYTNGNYIYEFIDPDKECGVVQTFSSTPQFPEHIFEYPNIDMTGSINSRYLAKSTFTNSKLAHFTHNINV